MTARVSEELPDVGPADLRSVRGLGAGTAVQLFARLVGVVMGAAVAAVLARGLGVEEFGAFSLLLALVVLAANVGDLGISQVAISQMAGDSARRAELAGGLVAARLISGLLLALAVGGIGSLLLSTQSGTLAAICIAATLPLGAMTALQSVAQARLRPHVATIMTLAQSALWLVGVVSLATIDAPLPAYAAIFLFVAFVQGLLAVWLTRDLVRPRFYGALGAAVSLLRRSWPLGIAGLFVTAYYRLDTVILYRLAGAEQTALYAAAYRFLDVLQVIPITAAGILLPVVSRLYAQNATELFGRAFSLAFGVLFAVAAPVAAVGAVLAQPIVRLIYGSEFLEAGPLLAMLLPAFASITLGYLLTAVLIATGRVKVLGLVAGVAAVLNVVANILLIPLWQARAAAVTTVFTEFCVLITIAFILVRQLQLSVPWRRLAAVCAATALAALGALALRPTGLAVAASGASAVYVGAVLLFRGVDVAQLRRMFARGATVAT